MGHVIAVAVKLQNKQIRHFITWGRTFERVDGIAIAAIVLKYASDYALGGTPIKAEVCYSLSDASESPYFHECLLHFRDQDIPSGKVAYQRWIKKVSKEQAAGHHLMYCGDPGQRSECRGNYWSML